MEEFTVISLVIIVFTILVIFIVEFLVYRKEPSMEELEKIQEELNQMDRDINIRYGLSWKHNAIEENKSERRQGKALMLLIAGLFLFTTMTVMMLTVTICIYDMVVAVISALILIIYSLAKACEKKRHSIVILIVAVIIGFLYFQYFDKVIGLSPYNYLYLCGSMIILGALSLFRK